MRRYGQILTSGSAMLALAMAAGLMAPRPLPMLAPEAPRVTSKKRNKRKAARRMRAFRRSLVQPYDSKRQRERGLRNRLHEQQRNSHKPGTVQPRHIFG